jgi:hypothetical protein
MNYNKGVEEGKKSQSPLWILSGFISIIGVFLVLLKNKNPKTDGLGDDYIRGYKKGVTKRRWLFFIIGFVLYMSIFTVIDKFSNSDTITKTEKIKRNTIIGTYYQKNGTDEWVTEINEDGSYTHKLHDNGELKINDNGKWEIKIIQDKFNSVKKSNESITEYKILVFDNKTFLKVDYENCLRGSDKVLQKLVMTQGYNLYPSYIGIYGDLGIYSPIRLDMYTTLCYDEELTNVK